MAVAISVAVEASDGGPAGTATWHRGTCSAAVTAANGKRSLRMSQMLLLSRQMGLFPLVLVGRKSNEV